MINYRKSQSPLFPKKHRTGRIGASGFQVKILERLEMRGLRPEHAGEKKDV